MTETHQVEYPDSFGVVTKSERPAGQVRWVNIIGYGKPTLQQAWEVITYTTGKATSMDIEWRDVPTVDGTD